MSYDAHLLILQKKYLFLSNLLFLVVFLKKYFHIQMPFEKLEPVLNF